MSENKTILAGSFTADELLRVIQKMADSNKEGLKEFAKDLAYNIAHPEPSVAQRQVQLAALAERAQAAKEMEAQKAWKRAHCMSPADPRFPHRRTGQQWQNWNGTPVIAWMYTYMTEKTPTGSREIGPYAFGVCQWCGTEFKPGDPDYEEALSWGGGMNIGTYSMNQNTGVWING